MQAALGSPLGQSSPVQLAFYPDPLACPATRTHQYRQCNEDTSRTSATYQKSRRSPFSAPHSPTRFWQRWPKFYGLSLPLGATTSPDSSLVETEPAIVTGPKVFWQRRTPTENTCNQANYLLAEQAAAQHGNLEQETQSLNKDVRHELSANRRPK